MAHSNLPLYRLVDEQLIASFPVAQREYMKDYYYSIYVRYQKKRKKRALSVEEFFSNMRRRKVKIIQICCPYCGKIVSIITEGNLANTIGKFNYCFNCGKPSVTAKVSRRYDRLARIILVHSAGKAALAELNEPPISDLELYTYDVMQLELVEIEATFETLLREIYNTFLFIKYKNVKEKFLDTLIRKDIANDFLNIDKANTHFKKALGINLKAELDTNDWNDLLDLVQLRNTIIHNDGQADEKFRSSNTFNRVQHMMRGDLIVVSESDVKKYMDAIFKVFDFLDRKLSEEFEQNAPMLIANSIFNANDDALVFSK